MARNRLYSQTDLLNQRRKKASPPPATPNVGTTEDFAHPAAYEDPAYDKYEKGDTSAWAEDVHAPPYPASPPPATPNVGTTEEPDHPAYQAPKATTPATGPLTVAEHNARMPKASMEKQLYASLMEKSNLCIKLASAMNPRATDDILEKKAFDLMDEDMSVLSRMATHFGVAGEEEEEEDEEEAEKKAFNSRLARIEKTLGRLANSLSGGSSKKASRRSRRASVDDEIEALLSDRDLIAQDMDGDGVDQNDPEYGYVNAFDELMMEDDYDDYDDGLMMDEMDLMEPDYGLDEDLMMDDDYLMAGDEEMDDDDKEALLRELLAMEDDEEDEEDDEEKEAFLRRLYARQKQARRSSRRSERTASRKSLRREASRLRRAAEEDEEEEDGKTSFLRELLAMEEEEEEKKAFQRMARRRRRMAAEDDDDEESEKQALLRELLAMEDDEEEEDEREALLRELLAMEDDEEDGVEAGEEEDDDEIEAGEEEDEEEEESDKEALLRTLLAMDDDEEEEVEASKKASKKARKSRKAYQEVKVAPRAKGTSIQSGAGGNSVLEPAPETPQVSGPMTGPNAKKARKAKKSNDIILSGHIDPMGLHSSGHEMTASDFGMNVDPLMGLLQETQNRFAGEEEDDDEIEAGEEEEDDDEIEAGEEEEEVEVEEVEATKKKASRLRPQVARQGKTASVNSIPRMPSTPNVSDDDLSKLWPAPPNINLLLNQ